MARKPDVWFRKFDGWWYTTIKGVQHKLARAERNDKGKVTAAAKAAAKKQAQKAFHKLMAELPPTEKLGPEPTFAQVANAFLEDSQKNNAEDTYRGHKRFLKAFCRFLHSKLTRPAELKPHQVYRWVGLHENWGDSTRRVAMNTVQACLNWGVKMGYIADHPLKTLEKPPAAARDEFVTPEQQEKIMAHLRTSDPFRDFFFALGHSGCRPSEVRRVQCDWFDDESGTWTLPVHKTRKKTGKTRVVYLTPELHELTRKLVRECGGTGAIFRNRDNRPWSRSAIGYRFRKMADELNIPGLSSYLVRHAFITNALERGLSDTVVAELAGNSPVTIRRHYNHLSSKVKAMREAAMKAVGSETLKPTAGAEGPHQTREYPGSTTPGTP
jgi:integrase